MADYKLDINRGDDSNDGIAAPWKNLSKLATATFVNGDNVLFANDSTWEISAHVVMGTLSGKVLFSNYDPGGAPSSLPTITFRRSLASGDWTYDAPNNAWYFDIGYDPGWGSLILFGGEWGLRQEAALPLVSVPKCWINSGNRFYVWAPSTTDPTTYYGSVVVGPHFRGALTFSNDGDRVIVENLRAANGGCLIDVFSSSGTRSFVLRDLHAYNTGIALFLNSQTAGDLSVRVERLEASRGITGFIHAVETGGLGFGAFSVLDCDMAEGNYGYPQGAIYTQVRKPHLIAFNRIRRMAYGSTFHQSDGCGIYVEVGADRAFVVANLLEDMHLALQDNSGRTARFVANVIKDCYAAARLTDASAVGSTSHTFDHNTVVNGGRGVAPRGPGSVGGAGWYSDTNSLAVALRNNLFHGNSTQPAIELGASATGTIANNNQWGYASLAARFDGAASPISPSGSLNVDPQFDGDFTPLNTALHAAGTFVGGRDFYGKMFRGPLPTIGAVQWQPERDAIAIERAMRAW